MSPMPAKGAGTTAAALRLALRIDARIAEIEAKCYVD